MAEQPEGNGVSLVVRPEKVHAHPLTALDRNLKAKCDCLSSGKRSEVVVWSYHIDEVLFIGHHRLLSTLVGYGRSEG